MRRYCLRDHVRAESAWLNGRIPVTAIKLIASPWTGPHHQSDECRGENSVRIVMAPLAELDWTPKNVYLREASMDDCEDLNEIAVGELRDTKLEELTDEERLSIKDSYSQ